MPNRKNAEANEPSRKYLSAASWREQPPAAGQRAQQVERQREDLERDEHGQQVVRRDEQHHAAEREQRQRVHLGAAGRARGLSRSASVPAVTAAWATNGPPVLQRPLADQQQRHDAEHDERALQEQRRPVDRDRAAGGESRACRASQRSPRPARRPGRAAPSAQLDAVPAGAAARTPRPAPRRTPRRTGSASARAPRSPGAGSLAASLAAVSLAGLRGCDRRRRRVGRADVVQRRLRPPG